jgi:Major Facilitator Superfamily
VLGAPAGPVRILAASTLVNTAGTGLFLTGSVLFFTRSVGLSPAQVGLGLTIAGFFGLVVGVPAGHLADRAGAREVLVGLNVGCAASMASFALVRSFASFVVVASVYAVFDRGASAVRQALVAGVLPPEERVRGRAYLRAVTNVGISLGAAAAGLALVADTRAAYLSLVLVDAVSYLLAAALLLRLPRVAPQPAEADGGGMLAVLSDRPFAVVVLLNAVLSLHQLLLEVALPLWVVGHTEAPRSVVAVLILVNTVLCVLLQVRASRGSDTLPGAARACRTGGLLLGLSCLVYAAAAGRSPQVAVAVLVVGALVHVLGEVVSSAGGWGLGFGLAPDARQGQYQGLFSTGMAGATMLGPVLLAAVVVPHGTVGFAGLALVFALAGAALVPVTAWAARRQEGVVVGTPA